MKSFHLTSAGSLDNLVLRERPLPRTGAFDVLVRIRANSINARDASMVLGQYTMQPRADMVPLCDGVGEVVAVGEQVTLHAPGDRVAAVFHQAWLAGARGPEVPRSDLGGTLDGLLAEYAVLPEQGWVRISDYLSYAEAAALPAAGVTAWSALRAGGEVLAGQTVLVQGSGGVSVFACQLAKLAGAKVIALSRSQHKLEHMKALGADVLIDTQAHPLWAKEVMRVTNGRGVDLAIEVIGEMEQTFRATRIGGHISFVGRLGDSSATCSLVPVQLRNLRLTGIGVGSRADFLSLLRLMETHQMRPVIDQRFPFSKAREAFAAFLSPRGIGKIVIEQTD